MLMQKDNSGLLVVDIQEKLTPHVLQSQDLIKRSTWLIRLAHTLNVPIIFSEQYPKGLGSTIPELKTAVNSCQSFEKTHFSCYQSDAFLPIWNALGKTQVVIIGIETHVCVMQTALDLSAHTQWDIFVVVDAVQSRSALDNQYGLKRMKQQGIQLVTSEMVFFEWVNRAATPEFKALSQSFLR